MKIGIIVAMDKELHQLQQLFNDGNVLVQKCGIGKVNAALGAQRMINEFHPDCIISSGCAGGNGDDINVQDVVVSSELCYHDVYCGRAIDDSTFQARRRHAAESPQDRRQTRSDCYGRLVCRLEGENARNH